MQTIQAMLGFPNGTPIDAVQAQIAKVFEYRELTGEFSKSVQNAYIRDSAGNEIRLKVWGHPNIAKLEGQEVVIHASSQGKGLKISDDNFKGQPIKVLEVSKAGGFQLVAVFHAQNQNSAPTHTATPPATQNTPKATGTGNAPIRGDAAGNAITNATNALVADGKFLELARKGHLADALVKIGSQIIQASLRLQDGEGILSATPASEPAATPATQPPAVTAPAPASKAQDNPPDDVPF